MTSRDACSIAVLAGVSTVQLGQPLTFWLRNLRECNNVAAAIVPLKAVQAVELGQEGSEVLEHGLLCR